MGHWSAFSIEEDLLWAEAAFADGEDDACVGDVFGSIGDDNAPDLGGTTIALDEDLIVQGD